jgi:hypothetical protein
MIGELLKGVAEDTHWFHKNSILKFTTVECRLSKHQSTKWPDIRIGPKRNINISNE